MWGRFLHTTICALLILLGSCDELRQMQLIKLAHSLGPDHPVHAGMVYMDERLREKSGGTLGLEIYASGQLGSERESVELLQIGSMGMTKASSAVIEAFAPSYKVFSVPYLFRDDAHRWAVLDGPIGRQILLDGDDYWLRGLCYYDAGFRSFYTTSRRITSPADMTGMKIRTQESPSAFALIRALGASATPIAWGELYTALQQGVVDAAENNPPSFYLSRHYEVSRYFIMNEHTSIPDVLLISTKVWNALTPEQQQWLQEAADESSVYQRELWRQASDDAMKAVADAGVEVIHPDKQPFAERTHAIEDQHWGEPELKELIRRIRSTTASGGN